MDTNNPVIRLCIQGTQAEFAGNIDEAIALYWNAWLTATDAFEKCVAAHYVAHLQKEPQDVFDWNLVALTNARAVGEERIRDFYPSLYLNMGRSYELLGDLTEAQRYYTMAAELGHPHQAE